MSNIRELEKRAETDKKAEKALHRVRAMLRSTVPTVEGLRKRGEQRLETFVRHNAALSGRDAADSASFPRLRPSTDRML